MSKINQNSNTTQKINTLNNLNQQLNHISQYLPQTTQKQKIITAYSPKLKSSLTFTGKGRTMQNFKEECDINKIMAKFQKTGIIEFTNNHEPQYGDCTGLEYQNAMETVAAAQTLFEELPSSLRKRFENDPEQFLAFVEDDRNRDEAEKMGLLKPRMAPTDDIHKNPATSTSSILPQAAQTPLSAKPEGVSGGATP